MRFGLRKFGEGEGRDVCEVETDSILLTVDDCPVMSIWDVGTVDWETAGKLEKAAKIVEEHPTGGGEFLVMELGTLCEIVGMEEPWFRDSLVIAWLFDGDDEEGCRVVVTDLLFE